MDKSSNFVPAHQPPGTESNKLGALPLRYRQLFIDTMNLDLATLEQALARRNATEAAQVLHRIRGAFLSLQIPWPGSHAEALEHTLKTTAPSAAVWAEVRDVSVCLRSLLRSA